MSAEYYMRVRGRVLGPFDEKKLQGLARRGQLSRIHEVSTDNVTWEPASAFPNLFNVTTSTTSDSTPHNIHEDSSDQWFYTKYGQQQGPVDMGTLARLISGGELSHSDMIWRKGMGEWIEISKAHGLLQLTGLGDEAGRDGGPAPFPAAAPRHACSICGGLFPAAGVYNDNGNIVCVRCFTWVSPVAGRERPAVASSEVPSTNKGGRGAVTAGYLCALAALFIFPPIFGIAGLVCGIVNLIRGIIGHGIAQLVVSMVCMILGMALGAAMMN